MAADTQAGTLGFHSPGETAPHRQGKDGLCSADKEVNKMVSTVQTN